MKTIYKLTLFASLLVVLFSCQDSSVRPTESTNLFLRNKGANMPVWVRGNGASNQIVLFLHGGPGDCSMCYRYYLKELEQNMMVAYWDQRVAGSSSGKVDPATLRYDQFNEDLELVVKLLKREYPNARIYFLAHSFGVELAWQYLTKGTNQQQVAGLMAVNGMYSYYRWLYHVREWALREARRQQNREAETYLLAHPVTPENTATIDWEAIYRWMYKLGGNPISLYSDKKYIADYALNSHNTALAQFTHGKAYGYYGEVESRQFEKGPLLKTIRVPVGLFWGAKDGVVPLEIAGETKAELVNSPVTEVTFAESWHEPFVTETSRFNAAVRAFVKAH